MAGRPKPIKVSGDTDWPRLLDEAAEAPVLLERDDEEITAGYDPDPDEVRGMLARTIGTWADLDVDQVVADLYAARRAGTRPPDRP